MLHASYDHSKQSSDQSLPRLCLSTIDGNNSEVEMLLLVKETKYQKAYSISSFRDFFLHSCTCALMSVLRHGVSRWMGPEKVFAQKSTVFK